MARGCGRGLSSPFPEPRSKAGTGAILGWETRLSECAGVPVLPEGVVEREPPRVRNSRILGGLFVAKISSQGG